MLALMLEKITAYLRQNRLKKSAEKHIEYDITSFLSPIELSILQYSFFFCNQLGLFFARHITSTRLSMMGVQASAFLSEINLTDRMDAIALANAIAPLIGPVGTSEGTRIQ